MNAGQPSRSSFGAAREIPFGSFRKAIGEELERTRAAVKKRCALGELIQEGDGARGQKAVYLLTRAG